jgi:hypothetical protein
LTAQVFLVISMSRSDDAALEIKWYYVCTAGGAWAGRMCGTATPSELWIRGDQVPGSTRERWYCPACNSRYRESFGVVIEILGLSTPHVGHYAAAAFRMPTQWQIPVDSNLHPPVRENLRIEAFPNSLRFEFNQLALLPFLEPW